MKVGEAIEDFVLENKGGEMIHLRDLANGKPLVIFFHRFYGCILAQYEIARLAEEYEALESPAFAIAFVVQSAAADLGDVAMPPNAIILCDPLQKTYRGLSIPCAASKDELGGGDTLAKLEAARARGYVHGVDSGNELQLPAVFAIDGKGTILYLYYGRNGGDTPGMKTISQALLSSHPKKAE